MYTQNCFLRIIIDASICQKIIYKSLSEQTATKKLLMCVCDNTKRESTQAYPYINTAQVIPAISFQSLLKTRIYGQITSCHEQILALFENIEFHKSKF